MVHHFPSRAISLLAGRVERPTDERLFLLGFAVVPSWSFTKRIQLPSAYGPHCRTTFKQWSEGRLLRFRLSLP